MDEMINFRAKFLAAAQTGRLENAMFYLASEVIPLVRAGISIPDAIELVERAWDLDLDSETRSRLIERLEIQELAIELESDLDLDENDAWATAQASYRELEYFASNYDAWANQMI